MGQRLTQRTLRANQPVLETAAHLRMSYVPAADWTRRLSTSVDTPLAVVSFGAPVPSTVSCPVITLDLPQLSGPSHLEVWTSDQPVAVHQTNGFSAAMSGEMLAATLHVAEEPGVGLQPTTERAYLRLLHHLRELGYPYLWRIWNYFPGINEDEQGLERYRQFCIGRHQALSDSLHGFPDSLPAGTAVGTRSGPLQLFVLAGTHPAVHLGNPRQIHAYEYPQSYGPCSPSFARATLLQSDLVTQLCISGTASVVGHESRHIGKPAAQALETVENLRALIAHAGELTSSLSSLQSLHRYYKVYVRHPEQLAMIQHALNIPFFASSQVIYLQGDLCRRQLLVEIEGVVTTD
jgi:chorismate lyase/3-hydroxybenzoate synthase